MPHHNPKELQYKFHYGESHRSPEKTLIICSCFVGLTPVLIFAACEIQLCMKAAGF
jgi:hypothetical protein